MKNRHQVLQVIVLLSSPFIGGLIGAFLGTAIAVWTGELFSLVSFLRADGSAPLSLIEGIKQSRWLIEAMGLLGVVIGPILVIRKFPNETNR